MEQLRSQGLSKISLILCLMQLLYLALCSTSMGRIFNQGLKRQIDASLHRVFSFVYCSQLHSVRELIAECDKTLFHTLSQPLHCLYQLMPLFKDTSMSPRSRDHNLVLPSYYFELYKRSFINRSLFNYVYQL